MTGLYIGSTTPKAGKTLFSFSLGILFQEQERAVGYMKPIGLAPKKIDGITGDTDALIVQELLGQNVPADILTPIMLPHPLQRSPESPPLEPAIDAIAKAYARISQDKDVTLVNGTEYFPTTGSFCDADGTSIINALGLKTILVEAYTDSINYDACLYLHKKLQGSLTGIFINNIPEEKMWSVTTGLVPYLKSHGVPVLGVVPHEPALLGMRISDLAHELGGYILAANSQASHVIQDYCITSMQVDNFMIQISRQKECAVVVEGDRIDLQLAALHSKCPCLILTGNYTPSPLIQQKAEASGIPIIAVQDDTYRTARTIFRALRNKKLRDLRQIRQGIDLIRKHISSETLMRCLD